jgi:hypothetical protein
MYQHIIINIANGNNQDNRVGHCPENENIYRDIRILKQNLYIVFREDRDNFIHDFKRQNLHLDLFHISFIVDIIFQICDIKFVKKEISL